MQAKWIKLDLEVMHVNPAHTFRKIQPQNLVLPLTCPIESSSPMHKFNHGPTIALSHRIPFVESSYY